MMKFFRKHMKKLLMVFMVALMIVFVGGTALSNLLERDASMGDEVRGTIYDRTVEQREVDYTNYHAQTLSVIYPIWRDTLSPPQAEPLSDLDFFMLVTEAVNNKTYVSPSRIEQVMEALPVQRLDSVRNQNKRSLELVRRAIEVYLMVQENMAQAAIAAQPSEADIQHMIRQITEKADVSMLAIPAREYINDTYEPSDEDLAEHFEQYKNEPREDNFRILEFAYQLPETVQVEYLQVSAEALTAQQTVTEQEAYDHWKNNKNRFLAPSAQTQPATNPANRPKRLPYETFTEAKADVIERLQNQKGKDATLSVARELITLLSMPWSDAPTTQPEGYKEPPASEKADGVYQKLIDRLQGKYAGILKYGRTELMGRREANRAAEIGPTSTMLGTPLSTRFTDAAFMVPGTSASREENKQRPRFFRNIWETCSEPLTDFQGNAYVFRTIAARPAQPPASFEDVRDDLVRDLRNLLAYQEAEQAARNLVESMGDQDLEATLMADADLVSKLGNAALRKPPPFPRAQLDPYSPKGLRPARVLGAQSDEAFIDLCFASPEEERYVKIYEQKQFGQWVIVERHKIIPVNRVDFDEQRDRVRGQLMRQAITQFRDEWLTPDNIHKRVAWSPAERAQPAEQEGDEAETETESESAETTS